MKKYLQVMGVIGILSAFSISSRMSMVWEIALIIYVIAIFMVIWIVVKLLRKPDLADRTFSRYTFYNPHLRYKNRKNT